MREIGWLEKEFQAANKRVSEWPEWKKEIEARNSRLDRIEPEPTEINASAEIPNE